MKKVLVLGFFFSASLYANTMLTIETKLQDGKAIVTATNTSGMNLECDYKINWRTSLVDRHVSWGTTTIAADSSVSILVEDSLGLPVRKATPHFECDSAE